MIVFVLVISLSRLAVLATPLSDPSAAKPKPVHPAGESRAPLAAEQRPVATDPTKRPSVHQAPTSGSPDYNEKHIWFRQPESFDAAVRGPLAVPLPGRALYLAIDRPDLADAMSARQRTKLALYVSGCIATTAGVVVTAVGIAETLVGNTGVALTLGVGSGLMVAGGSLIVTGAVYSAEPVSFDDAQALAEQHNARMFEETRRSLNSGSSFNFVPLVAPGHAGFSLAGRF